MADPAARIERLAREERTAAERRPPYSASANLAYARAAAYAEAARIAGFPHSAEQQRDTLLAGLKAEVERLRAFAKQCEVQEVADAAKAQADRLEHLLEQVGGKQ